MRRLLGIGIVILGIVIVISAFVIANYVSTYPTPVSVQWTYEIPSYGNSTLATYKITSGDALYHVNIFSGSNTLDPFHFFSLDDANFAVPYQGRKIMGFGYDGLVIHIEVTYFAKITHEYQVSLDSSNLSTYTSSETVKIGSLDTYLTVHATGGS